VGRELAPRADESTRVLELDDRPFLTEPPPVRPRAHRVRWVLAIGAVALFAVALAFLIADQVTQHNRDDRAHHALGTTRRRSHTVSVHLEVLQRDLSVLKTQVGSDTTALNQDSSQLLGAQTSLSAAQAHVTQQASLITSLQTCLIGVEQALNELAVGKQSNAIAALNSVSSSCAAAEASSG
jgi:hypothetical protein